MFQTQLAMVAMAKSAAGPTVINNNNNNNNNNGGGVAPVVIVVSTRGSRKCKLTGLCLQLLVSCVTDRRRGYKLCTGRGRSRRKSTTPATSS